MTGENMIAGERRQSSETFRAKDAATGEAFGEPFFAATDSDVADACEAAAEAQKVFGALPLSERAAFLRLVADKIDALGDTLTQRAMKETGLPEARLNGERGRTVGQLRLFAAEVENGAWQALRIDHADADRTPPKPDLRLRMIPLGPVAVFGASNFPLAFSVAGGDTASAFAAGCCVVVKGHPAHPGTSELVAGAITEAVAKAGLPAGVFSLLNGTENTLGEALVKDPRIAAVGFTGSRGGGLALMRHAAERRVPIPVYAEMSSVNPVTLLPSRLAEAPEDLAQAYVGSLSMGAGQFCTNPGIAVVAKGVEGDAFVAAAKEALEQVGPQVMLTDGIAGAYRSGRDRVAASAGVQELLTSTCDLRNATPYLYRVSGKDWLTNHALGEEVFGPLGLIVTVADFDEMLAIARSLQGQLTCTIHMDAADTEEGKALMPVLERKAGRLLANGFPTGVEVCDAMVHGGPYPASTNFGATSVGTLSIRRFLRPVCYQNMPQYLLPEDLR